MVFSRALSNGNYHHSINISLSISAFIFSYICEASINIHFFSKRVTKKIKNVFFLFFSTFVSRQTSGGIFYLLNMFEPVRTVRVLGGLVFVQGASILLFWKVLAKIVAVGAGRYANFSGKMAKAFFSQDRALAQLLQTGSSFLTPLFILGLLISLLGILMIAFPKQTAQILSALRILIR